MAAEQTIVIVGASLAGAKAAETLREEGFGGRVVLVGDEPDRPYERPPLSKGYLRGESAFDEAAVHEAGFYAGQAIELITSTRVASIDLEARRVELDRGDSLGFDQLLLTTGAEPRRLRVEGADLAGIHYLRSRASCDALREALAQGSRVVVVGAGWIGTEVAASARQLGKEVALVEASSVPLERVLGAEVGAMFAELHADHGVELHLGTGVDRFAGGGSVEEVVLEDGSRIAGDVFVVGVGVTPRTKLAEAAGLAVDNGVLVDAHLETGVPGVFAAGDVANAEHPLFGGRIRLEHWAAALNQGPAAARNLLGAKVPYDAVPYFFSDQFDLGMEYNGLARRFDRIVYRGDRSRREVIVFWTDAGRVVAGMNVNVWDVSDDVAALVRSQARVDLDALADPEVPLSSLVAPKA